MQMKRACTFLDKGGVGKTTGAAHLGVALAEQDQDVLLIDLAGKQNDLAKHFGLYDRVQQQVENENDWPNISTVFDESWDRIADQLGTEAVTGMVLETNEGPDLIPAHEGLDSVDDKITSVTAPERYYLFNEFLDEYVEPLGYDVVLVDLPGNTGNVALNGIFAARNIIVPAEPGEFEDYQIKQLLGDIDKYNEELGADIRMTMVMPNKVDTRTNIGEEFLDGFVTDFTDAISPAYVPKSVGIKDAQSDGMTVFGQAEDERLKTASRAVEAYRENASELLDRLDQRRVAP